MATASSSKNAPAKRNRVSGDAKKIIAVACVVFAVLLVVALIINIARLSSVKNKEKALLSKINQIERMLDLSGDELDYKKSAAYIDWYARNFLNMIGKDEIALIGKK